MRKTLLTIATVGLMGLSTMGGAFALELSVNGQTVTVDDQLYSDANVACQINGGSSEQCIAALAAVAATAVSSVPGTVVSIADVLAAVADAVETQSGVDVPETTLLAAEATVSSAAGAGGAGGAGVVGGGAAGGGVVGGGAVGGGAVGGGGASSSTDTGEGEEPQPASGN